MDYTLSPGYATHAETGQRLHRENQAVPTAVSEKDMNSVIWSMMEVVRAAELAGVQFDPDTPTSYQVFRNAIKVLINRAAQSILDQLPALSAATLRPGDIIFNSGGVPRPGTVKGNGPILLREDYPELFAYAQADGLVSEADWAAGLFGRYSVGDGVTTFRGPDFRAVVLRALDDGAGIDPGRERGRRQASQFAAHFHTGVTDYEPDHVHDTPVTGQDGLATNDGNDFSSDGSLPLLLRSNPAGGHVHPFTTGSVGGSETRMINIAVPFLIKT